MSDQPLTFAPGDRVLVLIDLNTGWFPAIILSCRLHASGMLGYKTTMNTSWFRTEDLVFVERASEASLEEAADYVKLHKIMAKDM